MQTMKKKMVNSNLNLFRDFLQISHLTLRKSEQTNNFLLPLKLIETYSFLTILGVIEINLLKFD